MKFDFVQLYSEVGVSYYIPSSLIRLLRKKLDNIEKSISHFTKLFSTGDFTLCVYISTMLKLDELSVTRPIVKPKRPEVEFSIKIPYVKIDDFSECMLYLLSCIEKGILMIFNKYQEDPSGIETAMQEIRNSLEEPQHKIEYEKFWKQHHAVEELYKKRKQTNK